MLTLALLLVTSQVEAGPPLSPPPLVSAPTTAPTLSSPPASRPQRAATLLDDSPSGRRLRSLLPLAPWKVALRTLTATLGAGVGAGLSVLLFAGLVAAGALNSIVTGVAGFLELMLVMAPVAHALVSAGTALGAALFGDDLGREFTRALPVAVAVSAVAALVLLLSFTIGIVAIPLACVVAGVATPPFIELFRSFDRAHEERRLGVVLSTF